jgi:hypothetical protein
MDASPTSHVGRLFDMVFGLATAVVAVLASLLLWIILFDHSGIEPGGATEHSASRLWPAFVLLIASSPVAWWYQRTAIRRLVVFGCVVLCTLASVAFYWFVLGCP